MSWARLEPGGGRLSAVLQVLRACGSLVGSGAARTENRHRGGQTARAGGVRGEVEDVDALRQPARGCQLGKRYRQRMQWLNTHGIRFDQVRIDVVLVCEGRRRFTIEQIRGVDWPCRSLAVLGRSGGSGRGGHRQRAGRDDPGRSVGTALGLPAVRCRTFPRQGSGQLSRLADGEHDISPDTMIRAIYDIGCRVGKRQARHCGSGSEGNSRQCRLNSRERLLRLNLRGA